MNTDNTKPLYTVNNTIDYEQYHWSNLGKIKGYIFIVKISLLWFMLLGLALFIFAKNITSARYMGIIMLMIGIIGIIGVCILYPSKVRGAINALKKRGELENVINFHENQVITLNESGSFELFYNQIIGIKENDKYVCVLFPKRKRLMLRKQNCSTELLNFLYEKFPENNKKKRNFFVKFFAIGMIVGALLLTQSVGILIFLANM